MSHILGIDPDLRNLSYCLLCEDDNSFSIGMIKNPSKRQGQDAVIDFAPHISQGLSHLYYADCLVIEGQDISYTGKKNEARKEDVMRCGQIAGVCIGVLAEVGQYRYFPKPREWKGTVDKHIHQCRTLDSFGIPWTLKGGKSPYPVPTAWLEKRSWSKIKYQTDWADIVDSMGLALWGRTKLKRQRLLDAVR